MAPAPSVQSVNRQTGLNIGSPFALGEGLGSGAGRWARLFLTLAIDIGFQDDPVYGQDVDVFGDPGWLLEEPWELVNHAYEGIGSVSTRMHVVETWTAFMRDNPLPATGTFVDRNNGNLPIIANATQTATDNFWTAPTFHDCICVAVTPGYAPSASRALYRAGTANLLAPHRWQANQGTGGTQQSLTGTTAGMFLQVSRLDTRNLGATYPNTGGNSFTGVNTANGFTIVHDDWPEWRVAVRNFEATTVTNPLIHTVAKMGNLSSYRSWTIGTLAACDVPDPHSPLGWVRGHIWG